MSAPTIWNQPGRTAGDDPEDERDHGHAETGDEAGLARGGPLQGVGLDHQRRKVEDAEDGAVEPVGAGGAGDAARHDGGQQHEADHVAQQRVEHRVDGRYRVLDDHEVEAPHDGDHEQRRVGEQDRAPAGPELHGRRLVAFSRQTAPRVGHAQNPPSTSQSAPLTRPRAVGPPPPRRTRPVLPQVAPCRWTQAARRHWTFGVHPPELEEAPHRPMPVEREASRYPGEHLLHDRRVLGVAEVEDEHVALDEPRQPALLLPVERQLAVDEDLLVGGDEPQHPGEIAARHAEDHEVVRPTE